MIIHNTLPLLLECLTRWEKMPTARQFDEEYAKPMIPYAGDFFEDFHGSLRGLDWRPYREKTLKLDPAAELRRVRRCMESVEELFGFKLEGQAVVFGAFEAMDGYARFDRGTHHVFLGVDEAFDQGKYLDILITHEFTHVARESRPEVWAGFGLNPKMTQSEFTEYQPVIEHLMGEGFSCAVSEFLVPGQQSWLYAYQSQESLAEVTHNATTIDRVVKGVLAHPDGDYGHLYRLRPSFAHYVWAWQWVKSLILSEAAGDPRKLVARCSKDFSASAHAFELSKALST